MIDIHLQDIGNEIVLFNMHYRPTFIRKYTDYIDKSLGTKCSDCQGDPTFTVRELDNREWIWCGVCDIG